MIQVLHYHFPAGKLAIHRRSRTCCVIPKWCPHIKQAISRGEAAKALLQLRRDERSPKITRF